MSRFLSLCAKRSTCGRLNRTVQWFADKRMDETAMCEVELGKAFAKVEHVGCAGCHMKRIDDGLERLTKRQITETDESKKMDARALLYAGLVAKEICKTTPCVSECFEKVRQFSTTILGGTEIKQYSCVSPIITILKQASEIGDIFAMDTLGDCLWIGDVTPRDKKKALKWYLGAAEKGNANTIAKLGDFYMNGNCVPQNRKKGIELYEQASGMWNAWAMVNLGFCFEDGDGVAESRSKAIEWCRRAADLGEIHAIVALAEWH